MHAIYVYNPHNSAEVAQIERAQDELGALVQTVEAVPFEDVKSTFRITNTPALIVVREDLQGENLLDEDNGQLRVTGELWKAIEEEEANLHEMETNRIDYLITGEISKKLVENAEALDTQILPLLDDLTPEQFDAVIAVLEIIASI